MPEEMWRQLPKDMYKALSRVQQAGAAVLSGLERLDELVKKLPTEEEPPMPIHLSDPQASEAIAAKLEEHVLVIMARPNRPKDTGPEYNCTPIPTSVRKRGMSGISSYYGSIASSRSPLSSGANSSGYMSPVSPAVGALPPSVMSPVAPQEVFSMSPGTTPFELGESCMPTISRRDSQVALAGPSKPRRDSRIVVRPTATLTRRDSDILSGMTRSTNGSRGSKSLRLKAPKDYNSTVYFGELESLRQKEMVRLRHSQRPLRMLYSELKREAPLVINSQLRAQYEEWWKQTEEKIAAVDKHIKGLCEGIHFSLGWADIPGLDNKYNHLDNSCIGDEKDKDDKKSDDDCKTVVPLSV